MVYEDFGKDDGVGQDIFWHVSSSNLSHRDMEGDADRIIFCWW